MPGIPFTTYDIREELRILQERKRVLESITKELDARIETTKRLLTTPDLEDFLAESNRVLARFDEDSKPHKQETTVITPELVVLTSSAICGLILIISFPLYLFSSNAERSRRARMVVWVSLCFFSAAGIAVLGNIAL